jgi:undecaprenyl-phosphate 4-deoxy-4-formamido-L-arabinose transferase
VEINEQAVIEHTISIVVPVYRGELTLDSLVSEIEPLIKGGRTPTGRPMRVPRSFLSTTEDPIVPTL